MKNMIKKAMCLMLASALVFTGAPAAVVNAAETENEAPSIAPPHNVRFEVNVDNEGIENLIVYWDAVEGAEGYILKYTFDYIKEREDMKVVSVSADETSVMIELPTEVNYGSVMVFASAVKGGVAGSDTEASILKTDIDAQMETAHAVYDAKYALAKKAQTLGKSDRKKDKTLGISCILKDINGDSIPELLYFRHYNRSEVLIYRYDAMANTAKLVKTTAGEKSLGGVTDIRMTKSGKGIVVWAAGSAYSGSVTTYKLTTAGKLKASSTYNFDYKKKKYTKNGKKISKAKLEKYLKSYKSLERLGDNTILYE